LTLTMILEPLLICCRRPTMANQMIRVVWIIPWARFLRVLITIRNLS
jgi:hypothetical protein